MREFRKIKFAIGWMYSTVDDPYTDNLRYCFLDNPEQVKEYKKRQKKGCCGCFDEKVLVNSRPAMVGCNYGH